MDIGQIAPDFTLPSTDVIVGNNEVTLSSLRGNIVVLFFYPKDMTPGCTTEATALSALKKDFDALGVQIIGISKDSIARHDKFIAKHNLNMVLVADEEGVACEAYGVWVLKKLYGREYMGIERSTYLIDAAGKIVQIWRKVRVKGHAEAVLQAVKAP
jgi:thioredoxin-dependent peroxiredoxin